VDGAREEKIHGRVVPVAARIEKIDSMSTHADRGETGPMNALKQSIEQRLGWTPRIPAHHERIEIQGQTRVRAGQTT